MPLAILSVIAVVAIVVLLVVFVKPPDTVAGEASRFITSKPSKLPAPTTLEKTSDQVPSVKNTWTEKGVMR